jgi:dolichyl-phosphate beta-glucosyltransferase
MTENSTRNPGVARSCIVIPCYNESARLPTADFLDFSLANPGVCFLFVNDGSRDSTLAVLQRLCSQNPRQLFYLDLVTNRGKAEAVRLGILHCLEHLEPQFVGFWDADLATPLDAIPHFLGKMIRHESLQMVFGARIRLLGHHVKRNMIRHYLGRLFATAVSIALRLSVYDTQCGAKLFRVSPSIAPLFAEPFLSRWIFDVEIIARVIQSAAGDRERVEEMIFELPLMQWHDIAGSKLHPSDFFRSMLEIYAIRSKYRL